MIARLVLAGALVGSACGDGGDTGAADADHRCTPDDADPASRCSSAQYWTDGITPSPRMRPGAACLACHATSPGAPAFVVAGTVYPSAHEPDDCYGASGDIRIAITDADARTFELTVGSSGNFFTAEPVSFPVTAEVRFAGASRAMCAGRSSGDCNGCHTEAGAQGAPGRIQLP